MTVHYEPERNRFVMHTDKRDAFVDIRWDGDVMVLPHAEVPVSLRGSGAGGRLALGTFELIERMGVTARVTCPFLVRVAGADPRWQKLFSL
jgi:predicted GNAT family acetyltransferase